jgi:hypothetical protein
VPVFRDGLCEFQGKGKTSKILYGMEGRQEFFTVDCQDLGATQGVGTVQVMFCLDLLRKEEKGKGKSEKLQRIKQFVGVRFLENNFAQEMSLSKVGMWVPFKSMAAAPTGGMKEALLPFCDLQGALYGAPSYSTEAVFWIMKNEHITDNLLIPRERIEAVVPAPAVVPLTNEQVELRALLDLYTSSDFWTSQPALANSVVPAAILPSIPAPPVPPPAPCFQPAHWGATPQHPHKVYARSEGTGSGVAGGSASSSAAAAGAVVAVAPEGTFAAAAAAADAAPAAAAAAGGGGGGVAAAAAVPPVAMEEGREARREEGGEGGSGSSSKGLRRRLVRGDVGVEGGLPEASEGGEGNGGLRNHLRRTNRRKPN